MAAKKLRPFHETILDAIKVANSSSLETIAFLLEQTSVPKNHAEIVTAWMDQCMSYHFDRKRTLKVAEILLEQGQADAPKTDPA